MPRGPQRRRTGGKADDDDAAVSHVDPALQLLAADGADVDETQLAAALAEKDAAARNAAGATGAAAAAKPASNTAAMGAVVPTAAAKMRGLPLNAPTLSHEEELRCVMEAREILQNGGSDAVGTTLKELIAKTKKIESDIATARKKADQLIKQVDSGRVGHLKSEQAKEQAKFLCQDFLASNEKLKKAVETQPVEDKTRREEVRDKCLAEVAVVRKKTDEQKDKRLETEAENAVLEKEFEEKKMETLYF